MSKVCVCVGVFLYVFVHMCAYVSLKYVSMCVFVKCVGMCCVSGHVLSVCTCVSLKCVCKICVRL